MSAFAARPNRFLQGNKNTGGRNGRLTIIALACFLLGYMFFMNSSFSESSHNIAAASDDNRKFPADTIEGDSIEISRTQKVMDAMREQLHNAESRAHQAETSLKSAMNKLKTRLTPTSLAAQDADEDDVVETSVVEADTDEDEDAGVVATTEAMRIELPVYTHDFVHKGLERQNYLRALTKAAGRVYCGVPSMYLEKKLVRWGEILRTWGKRCDVIKFFVDPVYTADGVTQVELPKVFTDAESGISGDIVVVPMVRKSGNQCWLGGAKGKDGKPKTIPCRHILEKVQRMWSYAGEHDLDKAEWFLKVDDDTFYMPENMKKFIVENGWTPDEPHYFGHLLMHHGKNRGLIAGALAAFSRETLRRIKPVYDSLPREYGDRAGFKHGRCVDRDGATEEVTTSICLRQVDVKPEPTFDEEGRERVLLFPPSSAFGMFRRASSSGWFFNGKDPLVKGGNLCCAVDAFAFHGFKRTNDMIRIDEVLYGNGDTLAKARELVTSRKSGGEPSLLSGTHLGWEGFKKEVEYLSAVREALSDFTVSSLIV